MRTLITITLPIALSSLLVIACTNTNPLPTKKGPVTTEEKADTSKFRLEEDYSKVFTDSPLYKVDIGNIELPTGEIIACDPFLSSGEKPFTRKVQPGSYKVSIYYSKIEENHYRPAFAKILFNNNKTVKWTMALTKEIGKAEMDSLHGDDFFGYGVDAGLGCFMDAASNKLYVDLTTKFAKEHPSGNLYTDLLESEFKKTVSGSPYSRDDGDYLNYYLDASKKHNIVMFSSGWGDGLYPSYWGLDAKGNATELLTDFLVVEHRVQ